MKKPYTWSTQGAGGAGSVGGGGYTPPRFMNMGLGDLCTDPSCLMTGPSVSLANPELGIDSSSSSTSSYLVWGAIAVMAFIVLLPKK